MNKFIGILLTLCLIASPCFAGDGTSSDLIAGWKLDDNAGNTTVVETTGTHTGTCTDNTSTMSVVGVPSASSTALDFDSADSEYITVPDNDAFSFTDGAGNDEPFTICFWMKSATNASNMVFTAKHDWADNSTKEWIIGSLGSAYPEFYVRCFDSDGDYIGRKVSVPFTASFDNGTWYWWCITYDASEANSGLVIYRGESGSNQIAQKDTTDLASGTYGGMSNTAVDVHIGCLFNTTATGFFDGVIDDVRIYDKVLTTREMELIYNNSKASHRGLENAQQGV